MARIMILGVAYYTERCEFAIYQNLPKKLYDLFENGFNGTFHFADGTYGNLYTFHNRKNIRMVEVRGNYYGSVLDLHTYLRNRRADVSNYIKSL